MGGGGEVMYAGITFPVCRFIFRGGIGTVDGTYISWLREVHQRTRRSEFQFEAIARIVCGKECGKRGGRGYIKGCEQL